MRFMRISYVKEGSILGKNIYDNEGRILLKKGVTLSNKILKKIQNIGIYSIYIDDGYSEAELEDVIKPELRNKAITTIKDTFKYFYNTSNSNSNDSLVNRHQKKKIKREKTKRVEYLSKISEDIMNNVVSNRNVMISLMDIKSMDNYTYQHCINVAVLSLIIGIQLQLNKDDLKKLCLGAMLHDIGKTFVSKDILLKEGSLTDEEYNLIKEHAPRGYEYLKDNDTIQSTARIISLQHHEKVDGSGYPKGLKGNKISKFAKIVAVADVYDALTSDRPYRPAMHPNEAIEYIFGNGGSHFDYEVVKAFSSKVIPYPSGTLLELSNNKIAIALETQPKFPLRPKVKVLSDDSNQIIDLMEQKDIVITSVCEKAIEDIKEQ